MLLCLKHHAMLGLLIDLNLRVVRTHMALCARRGEPSQRNGTGVTRMTCRARADCAVIVGLPDRVALLTAARHRRSTFCSDERMRRTFRSSGLVLLREGNLLRLQPFLPIDGRP